MLPDLVFDVGMHNGNDTAYYLARGYRVVAVEADPTLAEAGRERFAGEVRAGRLTIVNCAVGPEDTTAKFWICTHNRVWNSFDEAVAGRDGQEHYAIDVPVRRFAGLLAEHGVPFYLKIDIEGHDHYCLRDIDPADRPAHVSWEVGPIADLFMVQGKGYNAFKCVSQSTMQPHEPGPRRGSVATPLPERVRGAAKEAVRSIPGTVAVVRAAKGVLGRGPGAAPAAAAGGGEGEGGPARTVRRVEWPGGGWDFPFGSSGPFGPDLGGRWKTAEEVAYDYLDFWLYEGRHKTAWTRDWFDFHATTLPEGEAPVVSHASA